MDRTPSDEILLASHYHAWFDLVENGFYHFSQGTLDTEYWLGFDGATRANVDPVFRHYWAQLQADYGASFTEYMNNLLAEVPGE